MYQSNPRMDDKDNGDGTTFNELINYFETTVYDLSDEAKDNTEWDLDKIYKPVHACNWNRNDLISTNCQVLEKNNKVALVRLEDTAETRKRPLGIIECIYRLEDLVEVQ